MNSKIEPILESDIRSQGLQLYTQYINFFESHFKNSDLTDHLLKYFKRILELLSKNITNSPQSIEIWPKSNPIDVIKEYFGNFIKLILTPYNQEPLDFEALFATETKNFPNKKEIQEFIQILKNIQTYIHKFSQSTPFDAAGTLYELNLSENSKNGLGQYYTPGEIIDFILNWTLTSSSRIIMDPACGTGSFLIRVIYHIDNLQNEYKAKNKSEPISFWGAEISPQEAEITRLNLLSRMKNFQLSNIIASDFFNIQPSNCDNSKANREIPQVDAIIGNPPYTRHETIAQSTEKHDLLEKILSPQKKADFRSFSKRAGIYSYFILHAWNFLKEGGRLGFIIPNSWLDTEYGKDLQLFLLKHFKIVAIIDSKVERWFRGADINTVILILEKCSDEEQRKNHKVHFIQLKKSILEFSLTIPISSRNDDSYNNHQMILNNFKGFIEEIEKNTDLVESDRYHDRIISQLDLFEAGWDKIKFIYQGSKWSLHLRIPQILYYIFKTQSQLFTPLKNIAKIRSGIKTGANEFFYLTESQIHDYHLEPEFWQHKNSLGEYVPNWIIKSPRECNGVSVNPNDLKWIVLNISKSRNELTGTQILKYIEEGEKKALHYNRTCSTRKNWYSLALPTPKKILWEMIHFARLKAPYNPEGVYIDHNFFELTPIDPKDELLLIGLLNSTYMALIRELWGRFNLGDGSIKTEKVDIERFPMVSPNLFSSEQRKQFEKAVKNFITRPKTESIINELGMNIQNLDFQTFQLGQIWSERRAIDQILFTDLLHLSEKEQIQLYESVIDLVSTRLQKSESIL